MEPHITLVIGGYGFFGARICLALAAKEDIRLLVGCRDAGQALRLALQLGLEPAQAIAIDAGAADLGARFAGLAVATVIHTAGPFQGRDCRVARAAI